MTETGVSQENPSDKRSRENLSSKDEVERRKKKKRNRMQTWKRGYLCSILGRLVCEGIGRWGSNSKRDIYRKSRKTRPDQKGQGKQRGEETDF